jgi:hypothetical protein
MTPNDNRLVELAEMLDAVVTETNAWAEKLSGAVAQEAFMPRMVTTGALGLLAKKLRARAQQEQDNDR